MERFAYYFVRMDHLLGWKDCAFTVILRSFLNGFIDLVRDKHILGLYFLIYVKYQ